VALGILSRIDGSFLKVFSLTGSCRVTHHGCVWSVLFWSTVCRCHGDGQASSKSPAPTWYVGLSRRKRRRCGLSVDTEHALKRTDISCTMRVLLAAGSFRVTHHGCGRSVQCWTEFAALLTWISSWADGSFPRVFSPAGSSRAIHHGWDWSILWWTALYTEIFSRDDQSFSGAFSPTGSSPMTHHGCVWSALWWAVSRCRCHGDGQSSSKSPAPIWYVGLCRRKRRGLSVDAELALTRTDISCAMN